MIVERLRYAIAEADRFLKAARTLNKMTRKDQYYVSYGKESGACRRASLDLTRALAEMRKYR